MGQLSDFNVPGPTESAIKRARVFSTLPEGDAGLIHDAADTLQAAAVEVMDCLHQFETLDEQDREFAAMELPGLLAKVKSAAGVFAS